MPFANSQFVYTRFFRGILTISSENSLDFENRNNRSSSHIYYGRIRPTSFLKDGTISWDSYCVLGSCERACVDWFYC